MSGRVTRLLAGCGPALLIACAGDRFPGAPPGIVEECRREAALITQRTVELTPEDRIAERELASGRRLPEEARTEREEEEVGIADWPEDVLLYRCLASRGVALSDEQAAELADWEARLEPARED